MNESNHGSSAASPDIDAKHHIDTLEMLQEKTSGNLTDEETKILSEALHALRMAYVNTRG